MHLRDRGGSERHLLELVEQLAGGNSELAVEDIEHGGGGHRLDVVLEARELERNRAGHEVGACGQQLAELDEDAARFLQGIAQRDTDLAAVARAAKAGQRPKSVACT